MTLSASSALTFAASAFVDSDLIIKGITLGVSNFARATGRIVCAA